MVIHAVNYNPELSLNPPELDDATYEHNTRNDLREEICQAIDVIDERLAELEPKGHDTLLHSLGELRVYLWNDREG